MRLSVLYREPLHSVMDWPRSHVLLLLAYLRREPPVEERLEALSAQGIAIYVNSNTPEGKPKLKASEFLITRNAWPSAAPASRYSEADQRTLASLAAFRKPPQ